MRNLRGPWAGAAKSPPKTRGPENFVSDIFREIDEEVRRERLKKLWEQYSNLIIAVALLIIVGVGGWRLYQWWDAKQAAEAGQKFEAAVLLSEQNKHQEAVAEFNKLASEGTAGYRMLARFRAAQELAKTDPQAAAKAYDALAADRGIGPLLQDLAAVRAGLILVDTAPYEELRSRLEPLTGNDRPFHHTARELLALSAWRAGDATASRRWVDLILTDPQTPANVRTRAEMLMALTGGRAKG
jgi:hypothetical protein